MHDVGIFNSTVTFALDAHRHAEMFHLESHPTKDFLNGVWLELCQRMAFTRNMKYPMSISEASVIWNQSLYYEDMINQLFVAGKDIPLYRPPYPGECLPKNITFINSDAELEWFVKNMLRI